MISQTDIKILHRDLQVIKKQAPKHHLEQAVLHRNVRGFAKVCATSFLGGGDQKSAQCFGGQKEHQIELSPRSRPMGWCGAATWTAKLAIKLFFNPGRNSAKSFFSISLGPLKFLNCGWSWRVVCAVCKRHIKIIETKRKQKIGLVKNSANGQWTCFVKLSYEQWLRLQEIHWQPPPRL